jgi:RNA polymerase sigma factor for flagellar operon FliA
MPIDDASARRDDGDRAATTQQVQPATQQLLRRYHRRRTVAVRDQLVERHRATVQAMARSMALRLPPCVDPQDLEHAGIWGLMQAIDRFEPERAEQFGCFMRIRVRGAMLDELRNMDFLPRLYRRRLRDREQALARLRLELARDPSDAELAAELGVTVATLQRDYVRRGDLCRVGGIGGNDGEGGDDSGPWDGLDRLADDDLESPIEAIHRQELVAKIRKSLEPIEWRVLHLHYIEGMSGREVARRMRLSAARICQIHGRVLDRLKTRLRAAAV